MFSLQKLFGKDDKFFTLMEGSAEESRHSIRSMIQLMKCAEGKRSLDAFIESRRKDKQLTKELTEHLCKSFVTPLEREDIEALSHSLYKIPKTAEKFGERLLLAPQQVRGLEMTKQLGMLEKAADILVLMVIYERRADRALRQSPCRRVAPVVRAPAGNPPAHG